MNKLARTAIVAGALGGAALLPASASAYSVKVHIFIANEVRAEMLRNWNGEGCTEGVDPWCGVPAIRLLGPEDRETQYVVLSQENAEALRDHPEHWRGGAIGPDNTVFPGMTDPSHAWHFFPFSQCQSMLEAAEDPSERAYALGCFLHGVTDNNVHHVVNFFAGETFTLYPKDTAKDGELVFNLINVVRHMTVESKIEAALEHARPGALDAANLKHQIAKDLYRRVYLDPAEGRGLWHWFAGRLVERKNDALRAAQLDGFDPNEHLETSIEEIKESGVTIDFDGRVMKAYADFLKTGGTIDGLTPGSLAPHDYVLLLPEIVEDVKRLLDIAEARGVARMDELVAEWKAEGECTLSCPILRTKKKLWEHLFAERDGGERSRFGEAVDLKKAELDNVIDGYIASVERLSNLIVAKGVGGIGISDIAFAMAPLADAIDQVTDFPYAVLFPEWAVDIIESITPLRAFLEETVHLVTAEVKEQITERMRAYTEQLREQLLAMTPQAVQDLHAKAQELKDIALAQIDEAKLAALGIDLDDADAALGSFDTSVLYMNSFNSVAGVLADQRVVFATEATSFAGGGPVSFDASYQIGYTQLSVCEDLSEAFYPCGTSSIEVLQPDYTSCERVDVVTPEMEPPVECHDGSALEFDTDPNPATCVRRHFEEVVSPHEGHLGSYTHAFPAELSGAGPACAGLDILGPPGDVAGPKEDDVDADVADEDGLDGAGCGCTTSRDADPKLAWMVLLLGLVPVLRRRRDG